MITNDQKIYTEIVLKAWEDSEFKKALVENPVKVIEEFTGKKVKLSPGKTLVVVDYSENLIKEDDKAYFIIPENKQSDYELAEEELENVAGGLTVIIHYEDWSLDLTFF